MIEFSFRMNNLLLCELQSKTILVAYAMSILLGKKGTGDIYIYKENSSNKYLLFSSLV